MRNQPKAITSTMPATTFLLNIPDAMLQPVFMVSVLVPTFKLVLVQMSILLGEGKADDIRGSCLLIINIQFASINKPILRTARTKEQKIRDGTHTLKHSLPAIHRKRKQTEHLGSLTKHNNMPSRTELGNKSLSQKPRRFPILSGLVQPLKRY